MHLAEASDPRQTQPRHVSGFATQRLRAGAGIQNPSSLRRDHARETSDNFGIVAHSRKGDGRDEKVMHLIRFSSSLYTTLDEAVIVFWIMLLGGEPSEHLMREVPRENYTTTQEWVQAVKREVDEVLLPRARGEIDSPGFLATKAAEFIRTDRILEDLALEERLDAMIDRAMRRLAQMKFMKQLSRSSEKPLQSIPALQIVGSPKPKRQR
jgi:hypothetical protein